MFNLRNPGKKAPAIQLSKLSSLIAEDVVITGDVSFGTGLRIDGRVTGNVIAHAVDGQTRGLLVLSNQGQIEGSVRCADAVINGTVTGDLDVTHFLELQPNARVSGTIRYQHLKMDVGAAVHGRLAQIDALSPAADNVVELTAGPDLKSANHG
jgi:cytoskeletal protein CcmA (bactofilin family)